MPGESFFQWDRRHLNCTSTAAPPIRVPPQSFDSSFFLHLWSLTLFSFFHFDICCFYINLKFDLCIRFGDFLAFFKNHIKRGDVNVLEKYFGISHAAHGDLSPHQPEHTAWDHDKWTMHQWKKGVSCALFHITWMNICVTDWSYQFISAAFDLSGSYKPETEE